MSAEANSLANAICVFVQNTISGHESGFYKMTKMANIPEHAKITITMLKDSDRMRVLIVSATANYLNAAYRSLILEDDEYILKEFNGMAKHMNHSKICLLNLVFFVLRNVHLEFDRNNLDTSTYDKYMEGVKEQIGTKLAMIRMVLITKVSHNCSGMDIKTCDPNEPMFKFK